MTSLATHVRRAMQDAARPMRAQEIVDALDEPATGSSVRAVIGALVHDDVVVRHHSPQGLTYSLRAPVSMTVCAAPNTPSDAIVPRMPQARPPRKGTMQYRVLALLAGKAMTCDELAAAARGCMSTSVISSALQELRRSGWVVGDHHRPVTWTSLAVPVIAAPDAALRARASQQSLRELIVAAQHKLDSAAELLAHAKLALGADELPPCVGEAMRDAMHDIARNGAED